MVYESSVGDDEVPQRRVDIVMSARAKSLDGMRHKKVREREEDKKLLREGLSRKSETKRGGRAARDRRVGQTVWRPYAPTGATRHDDGDDD